MLGSLATDGHLSEGCHSSASNLIRDFSGQGIDPVASTTLSGGLGSVDTVKIAKSGVFSGSPAVDGREAISSGAGDRMGISPFEEASISCPPPPLPNNKKKRIFRDLSIGAR